MGKITLPVVVISLILGVPGQRAQADVEAVARMLFEQSKGSEHWLEGFAEAHSGKKYPFDCHRAASTNARIVRTTDGKSEITWSTAPVPKTWKGKSITFLWTAGMGHRPEKPPRFDLFVNGTRRFAFHSPKNRQWTVEGQGGGTLTFLAIDINRTKFHSGYMKMTVPAAWVKPGEPLRLKVVGSAAKDETLYVTFEYTDSAAYFRTHDCKDVYHKVLPLPGNLGAVSIRLVARRTWAGKKVSIRSERGQLGSAVFGAKGDLSSTIISCPRSRQGRLEGTISIIVDGKAAGKFDAPPLDQIRCKAFLDEQLQPKRYFFKPGKFPAIEWKRPGMVENEMGRFDLSVTYFDAEMKPVTKAAKPGRYGAVVTAKTADGYTMRRYITLFCTPGDLRWWADRMDLTAKPLEQFGITDDVWSAHQKTVNQFFGHFILKKIANDDSAAGFFAGLSELPAKRDGPKWKSNPWYRDRQWWVTFKQKEANLAGKYPALDRPIRIKEAKATVLHKGDPASVGYGKKDLDNIRAVCRKWVEDTKTPTVLLVARKGVIVLHEVFDTKDNPKPMTVDTPTWMASITKLLTGTLMMEFVDQGLIGLDDPVKKYLPELDCKVETDLTIRHLFTHTNGFWGHGTWGADRNASLENVVGQYLPYLKVGKKKQYNGIGYAVAGKVMERVSGRAIPYLFQERLLGPLGARHTKVEGTAGDAQSICMDMAKVGQMLLNKGTYGEYRFFSEKTFEKMLPAPLDRLVPGLEGSWGIGLKPYHEFGLNEGAFGHGAASGAIYRIDPGHDLIIVACRNRPGKQWWKNYSQIVQACTSPLAKKTK